MAASPLPYSSIQNHFLKLDYLTTTGPRIVGLFAAGIGGNLLAETPDVHWPTPHGEYYLQDGHRLWTAPGKSSELEEAWQVFVGSILKYSRVPWIP